MKKVLILAIMVYKKTASKIIAYLFGGGCKFTPNCSDYAILAIKKHGIFKGSLLSILRILKCNPFSKDFGWDPVN